MNYTLQELEKIVISGIITTRSIDKVCDILSADDFLSYKEKRVYQSMLSYFSRGDEDWYIQAYNDLQKDKITFSEYLSRNEVLTSGDIEFYAKDLKSLRRKTLLADLFTDSQSKVKGEKLDDFVISFERKFSEIIEDKFLISGGIETAILEYEYLQELYADKMKNGIELLGIDTGFAYLNTLIDGLRQGHLWVLGGYCLGKDTKVLMYDGSAKKVQDIIKGDLLCSVNDTKPRKVLATNIGSETMYKITGKYIDTFTVNAGHILPMLYVYDNYKNVKEIKITASEYINLSDNKKRKMRLLKAPAEFTKKKLKVEPYFMGYWLGDGTTGKAEITIHKNEKEIIKYTKDYAKKLNLRFMSRIDNRVGNQNVMTIGIKTTNGGDCSKRLNALSKLLPVKKIIPLEYMQTCLKDRLQLLAGLIDSDGYVSGAGRDGLVFCQKDYCLIKQVRQLAESCGFNTNIKKCFQKETELVKNCAGNEIYKLTITGHTHNIPIKIPRKQIKHKIRSCRYRKKDLPLTFEIEKLGVDNYYGFELDGNHLFLTQNNIVNHNTNTGKTFMALNIVANLIKQKKRVGVYSLEMSKVDIFGRLLGIMTGQNSLQLLKGTTTIENKQVIENTKEEIKASKMFLYTELSDLDKIKLSMIRENMKNKVDLFVIDYIQLMQAGGKSEYENMKMIITEFQDLAKQLKVSIIVLSQISNEAARNRNSVVMGFKGAGDIASASDFAIELLPDKEDIEEDKEFTPKEDEMRYKVDVKMVVKKNRHGMKGYQWLTFHKRTGIFDSKEKSQRTKQVDEAEQSLIDNF